MDALDGNAQCQLAVQVVRGVDDAQRLGVRERERIEEVKAVGLERGGDAIEGGLRREHSTNAADARGC